MNTVILVPRRDDNGPRDRLWDYCRAWWEREQSHMPIFEGYHVDGLFNRAAAVNRAAELAGGWDVAVIIDSDVLCDPERVKEAVVLASRTGSMVLPHDRRYDLTPGTTQLLTQAVAPLGLGFLGTLDMENRQVRRHHLAHVYSTENGHPSVSSVVVVPRRLWDTIGGFDEAFRGWGYEDTAFAAAAETFGGIVRMPGPVWHLWHPTAREGKRGTRTWEANASRGQRYRAAIGNAEAIRALQAEGRAAYATGTGSIPRILHRVVPEAINPQAEAWWQDFAQMHPDWDLRTHRDPLDPADWPLSSPHWDKVANGAQLADLVRLEALVRDGGVYVDQDVQPLRPLDSLLGVPAFAAWEDARTVPNAVLGAAPNHPAIRACLDAAIALLPGDTWKAGPGVTTRILPGRSDVLLLPPGSFYPYHYDEMHRRGEDFAKTQPWAFVVHHWWASWLPEDERPINRGARFDRRPVQATVGVRARMPA